MRDNGGQIWTKKNEGISSVLEIAKMIRGEVRRRSRRPACKSRKCPIEKVQSD